MQLENEYGSYGNDKAYLANLKDIMTDNGVNVPLLTSDGATESHLKGGTLDGIWATVNFGTDAEKSLDALKDFQPEMPEMCTEFWNGQGVRWGIPHRLRDPKSVAQELETILKRGANVNLYMFHGGTTFGFMNGGLQLPPAMAYTPFVTSYDTDAVLNEAGDPTEKFYEFRKLFAKYNPEFDVNTPIPPPSSKKAYGEVELTQSADLFSNLKELCHDVHESATMDNMEMLEQNYGFILYRTHLKGSKDALKLSISEPRDRAYVFINGKPQAVFHRNDKNFDLTVSLAQKDNLIDIMVENMGRINFGHHMEDEKKGITHGMKINDFHYHFGWEIFPLPMENLSSLKYGRIRKNQALPAFFKGKFNINDAPQDTFLKIPHGAKGVCWINGFNLGRYWNTTGPQFTLYVPAPLLRRGENTVEILELEKLTDFTVRFTDRPEV